MSTPVSQPCAPGMRKVPQLRGFFRDINDLWRLGWGARIRTWGWRNQNPLPYRLATPHQARRPGRRSRGGGTIVRAPAAATLASPGFGASARRDIPSTGPASAADQRRQGVEVDIGAADQHADPFAGGRPIGAARQRGEGRRAARLDGDLQLAPQRPLGGAQSPRRRPAPRGRRRAGRSPD